MHKIIKIKIYINEFRISKDSTRTQNICFLVTDMTQTARNAEIRLNHVNQGHRQNFVEVGSIFEVFDIFNLTKTPKGEKFAKMRAL